jgi:hypothetical protein
MQRPQSNARRKKTGGKGGGGDPHDRPWRLADPTFAFRRGTEGESYDKRRRGREESGRSSRKAYYFRPAIFLPFSNAA